MKSQASRRKPGPKPKPTKSFPIKLLPLQISWLEQLFAKGRFGSSVEDVAVNLLNDRFKQLFQEGELNEQPLVGGTIPFPNQPEQTKEENKNSNNLPKSHPL
jgi:hypothetical protein